MYYGLTNSLGRNFMGSRVDEDAAAYVALIEAAGATVTGAQVTQLSNFYKSAKSTGYYTSLKRLYLPIWEVAAANAIDMIGGTSGTFVGGVTHGAGFAQGNGTTGYLTSSVRADTLGMTTTSGFYGALIKTANSLADASAVSLFENTTSMLELQHKTNTIESYYNSFGSSQTIESTVLASQNGVYAFSMNAGARKLHRRLTAGASSTAGASGADGTLPPPAGSPHITFMCDSRIAKFSNAEYGAFFLGLGISDSDATAFTLAIKNLWEGCTGLTLP